MDEHVTSLLTSCSNSLYALGILKSHGMQDSTLQEVFKTKTLSKLLYASQAWWGFMQAQTINRIEGFIKKSKRHNYYPKDGASFVDLCDRADHALLRQIEGSDLNVLAPLMPEHKLTQHVLRKRKHNYALPVKDNRNFINRILFKNIY